MHSSTAAPWFVWLVMLTITATAIPLCGQEAVPVSQALPFAVTGTVAKGSLAGAPASGSNPGIIQSDETLVTGPDGEVSILLGGKGQLGTARLGKDTEVRLPKADDKGHSLELLKGQLFLEVNAAELQTKGADEFRLKTPTALLAVKGTRFFVILQEGKERAGAHEGQVDVTEATTQKVVRIEGGQVVEVAAGEITPPAPMTEEERIYTSPYEAATLTAMELPIMVEPESTSQLASIYKSGTFLSGVAPRGLRRVWGTTPPDLGTYIHFVRGSFWKFRGQAAPDITERFTQTLTTDGSVRVAWTPDEKGRNIRLCTLIKSPAGLNGEFEKTFMPRAVAIKLKVRGKNVQQALFDFSWVKLPSPTVNTIASLPPDSSWVEMLAPIQTYPAPTYKEAVTLMIQSLTDPALQRQPCALDLAGFTLYVTPDAATSQ